MKKLHGKWMDMILHGTKDMTLQAHRNSYKSTCLSVCIALMTVLQGDKSILLIRKTDQLVRESVMNVTVILESELFQAQCLKHLGQEARIRRRGASCLTTSFYTAPRGAFQLQGVSLGASLTGRHADIIITDDIVGQKDRYSEKERLRTARIYQELQNVRARGGRIINIGTPWHREDCFRLMPEARKYDCWHTHILSKKQIEDIRSMMVPSLFAANYELRLIQDEDALFRGPVRWTEEDMPPGAIAHIDAAYGGKDCTALTLIIRQADHFIVLGRLYKKSALECIDSLCALCSHYDASPVYCELNADKGFLALQLRDMGLTVRCYHESRNKQMKISTFLAKYWQRVLFVRDTDSEYIRQITDYTFTCAHDDAPDSLASALSILERQ